MLVISPLPPYDGSWARLILMKDGTIGFESLYDPDLVTDLKEAIPWQDRRWDRDQKLWFVAPKWAETLADLAVKHKMGRPQVPQADPWDAIYKEEDAHDNDYMGRYPIDSDDLP